MTTGHWYTNGCYLMNPGVSGAFTWNGSTTNYALYAVLVNSGAYTPDPYNDTYLYVNGANCPLGAYNGTNHTNANEPAAATGYLHYPVALNPIAKAQKTSPTADYVVYPANATNALSWTVNANQTLTAGYIIFYWDQNVAHSLVSPNTPYYPNGTNNAQDNASQLIGYGPFVDSSTKLNYWTTTGLSETIGYAYDTSFSGYSTILSIQTL